MNERPVLTKVSPTPEIVVLIGLYFLLEPTTFGWVCVVGGVVHSVFDFTMEVLRS